jgi:hypothetical protein
MRKEVWIVLRLNKYGVGGYKSYSYGRTYTDLKARDPSYETLPIFKAQIMYHVTAIKSSHTSMVKFIFFRGHAHLSNLHILCTKRRFLL